MTQIYFRCAKMLQTCKRQEHVDTAVRYLELANADGRLKEEHYQTLFRYAIEVTKCLENGDAVPSLLLEGPGQYLCTTLGRDSSIVTKTVWAFTFKEAVDYFVSQEEPGQEILNINRIPVI